MKEFIKQKLHTLHGSMQYLNEMTHSDENLPLDNIRTHGELIKNIGYDILNKVEDKEKENDAS